MSPPAGTRALRVRAYAKINLGLEVLGQREDGYHELRTLFQTIDLHDDVAIRPRPRGLAVHCDHPEVPRDERNLALRAALELPRHAGLAGGAEIVITKRIPVGGGLGGGSSDAAATLMALDRLWGIGLGPAGLQPLARRLGADVPFFLVGGPSLGLARVKDDVFACQDTCAPKGGPLSEGKLSGVRLACPWHGWMYDVRTGECVLPGRGNRVASYAVRVKAGEIWVELP